MHKLIKFWLPLLMILLAVLDAPVLAKNIGKKSKGIEIVQKSEVNGQNLVAITKEAAKIVCKNAGYTIIMSAPNWKVTIFNNSTKSIFEMDWKDFKLDFDYGSTIVRKARYSQMKVKKTIGYEQIKGFKSLHITRRNYIRANQTKKNKSGILNVARVDYWLVEENQIPKPVSQVVQNLYRLPELDGYPLIVGYTTTGSKKCQDVSLISVKRKYFGSRFFEKPKHFKRVKKLSQVMLDMEDAETMIELLLGN